MWLIMAILSAVFAGFTAILAKWQPIFEFIPIESQIEKFQSGYYDAIAKCHTLGSSTVFIEFMLEQIAK